MRSVRKTKPYSKKSKASKAYSTVAQFRKGFKEQIGITPLFPSLLNSYIKKQFYSFCGSYPTPLAFIADVIRRILAGSTIDMFKFIREHVQASVASAKRIRQLQGCQTITLYLHITELKQKSNEIVGIANASQLFWFDTDIIWEAFRLNSDKTYQILRASNKGVS